MLLISAEEAEAEEALDTDDFAVVRAWLADLRRRGVLQVHEGLHPSRTATTVRVRGDEVLLTDGPFAETKDQVGGFAIVECDDIDEAIEIATGHPAARFGQVEIRPVRDP
jgi:hypothetical protein